MNLAQQINDVIRAVRTGGGTHTVELTQTFSTDASDLWHAITSPERLAKWFEPVEGELTEGGRYRLSVSDTTGTIEKCEEPRYLRLTWEVDADASSVELTLTPNGEGTRLVLAHAVPGNEHRDTFGPSATGIGWDSALAALRLHCSGGSEEALAEIADLAASPAGRSFVEAAAESWQAAHLDSGAAPSRARDQAARTADFYLGEG